MEFILVETFQDDAAGDHVNSVHFARATLDMQPALVETSQIISEMLDASG